MLVKVDKDTKKVWLCSNRIWEKAKECHHEMKICLIIRKTSDKQMTWKISDKKDIQIRMTFSKRNYLGIQKKYEGIHHGMVDFYQKKDKILQNQF